MVRKAADPGMVQTFPLAVVEKKHETEGEGRGDGRVECQCVSEW